MAIFHYNHLPYYSTITTRQNQLDLIFSNPLVYLHYM
nr:MAG TPA: Eco57I restriction-modification methylase [Crassvirales sp.]